MAARKAAAETVDTSSWDAFWAEVNADAGATEVIRRVTVRVPNDLPLGFQQRVNELRDSTADEDVRELVALVFGEGVLDQWIANDMGSREFKVVLAWGVANGTGQPLSFREAYERVVAAEAEGKAPSAQPNRAARRAATKSPSSSTGATSRRTSSGSTASARRTSGA
ncbi:hypothetical protein [Streptomyces sp. NPDC020983]|uniref:hypothetical protein n=1 Tax=Streptomyces sp. NPDC020983 TaxID=3365106 RepID=UPI00378F29EB